MSQYGPGMTSLVPPPAHPQMLVADMTLEAERSKKPSMHTLEGLRGSNRLGLRGIQTLHFVEIGRFDFPQTV